MSIFIKGATIWKCTFNVSGCKWPIIGNDKARYTSFGGFDGPAPSSRFSLTNIGVEKHSGTGTSYSHDVDEFARREQAIIQCLTIEKTKQKIHTQVHTNTNTQRNSNNLTLQMSKHTENFNLTFNDSATIQCKKKYAQFLLKCYSSTILPFRLR